MSPSEALPPDHSYWHCVEVYTAKRGTGNCKWRTCPRSLHGG